MKLVIAIVHDTDSETVTKALNLENLRVTQIASSGGFLRKGNSTMFIGLEDEQVDKALEIIRNNCAPATDPGDKRAVIFVLKVDQYEHF